MLNVTVSPGSAHSAFLRAGSCAPAPLSSHSLSHRQLGPVHQQHRRATAKIEARRLRAPRSAGTRSRRCRIPPFPLSHAALKTEPPAAGRIFLPRAPFVLPVHARVPHTLPHHPGVHLAGFPLSEPLLCAGLHSSITAVRHPPVSAPLKCSFLQLTAASSPLGLPRAAGPSHPHR
jgi:hypothetical protein